MSEHSLLQGLLLLGCADKTVPGLVPLPYTVLQHSTSRSSAFEHPQVHTCHFWENTTLRVQLKSFCRDCNVLPMLLWCFFVFFSPLFFSLHFLICKRARVVLASSWSFYSFIQDSIMACCRGRHVAGSTFLQPVVVAGGKFRSHSLLSCELSTQPCSELVLIDAGKLTKIKQAFCWFSSLNWLVW